MSDCFGFTFCFLLQFWISISCVARPQASFVFPPCVARPYGEQAEPWWCTSIGGSSHGPHTVGAPGRYPYCKGPGWHLACLSCICGCQMETAMGSTMFDPEWTRRISSKGARHGLGKDSCQWPRGGKGPRPYNHCLIQWYRRSQRPHGVLEDWHGQPDGGGSKGIHHGSTCAVLYAQQAMAASEEMQRIVKRRQEEEQESQRQKERKKESTKSGKERIPGVWKGFKEMPRKVREERSFTVTVKFRWPVTDFTSCNFTSCNFTSLRKLRAAHYPLTGAHGWENAFTARGEAGATGGEAGGGAKRFPASGEEGRGFQGCGGAQGIPAGGLRLWHEHNEACQKPWSNLPFLSI